MDPQHTLFLEHAWDALESSGYLGDATTTRVGVFAGISISTYLIYNLLSHPDMLETAGGLLVKHTNDKDYVATRVSYKLNLRGPSMTVQTGCSTSLVATHLACQSLSKGSATLRLPAEPRSTFRSVEATCTKKVGSHLRMESAGRSTPRRAELC